MRARDLWRSALFYPQKLRISSFKNNLRRTDELTRNNLPGLRYKESKVKAVFGELDRQRLDDTVNGDLSYCELETSFKNRYDVRYRSK